MISKLIEQYENELDALSKNPLIYKAWDFSKSEVDTYWNNNGGIKKFIEDNYDTIKQQLEEPLPYGLKDLYDYDTVTAYRLLDLPDLRTLSKKGNPFWTPIVDNISNPSFQSSIQINRSYRWYVLKADIYTKFIDKELSFAKRILWDIEYELVILDSQHTNFNRNKAKNYKKIYANMYLFKYEDFVRGMDEEKHALRKLL